MSKIILRDIVTVHANQPQEKQELSTAHGKEPTVCWVSKCLKKLN